jgi:type I restriction enzyme S subunit
MHIVDGTIEPTRTMTITADAATKLSDFRLKAREVIIGRRGDMGRCAVVQPEHAGWLCGTGSMIIRPHGVDPAFLQRVLSSPRAIAAIEDASVGTTMVNLNQGTLAGLAIQFPPLPEQRAIATVLSDVDALLGGLDRFIAKKRDLKQAAMQQLLTGQTRLPGFHGEWAVKRIGEFTNCVAGGTPSTFVPSYWGGSIRWMSSGELHLKRVEDVAARITEEGLRNSAATVLPRKCVLVGLAGQGKTRGTVAINMSELATNQSIAAVLPSPAFVPEYLYYNLDRRYDELRDLSSGGGGRGGLNLKLIGSIPIPFPSIAEQTAIAAVLSDMDGELTTLEARRDKVRDLKQAMMQELLTGKTRLIPAGASRA